MKKVILVGIGNQSMGDDAAGLMVVERLSDSFKTLKITADPLNHVDGLCGSDVVVIVDAADFGGKPGEFRIIEESEIDGSTLSSHSLPLSMFVHLLKKCVNKVTVWGIQVKSLKPGEAVSPEVVSGIDKLSKTIKGMYGFYMQMR